LQFLNFSLFVSSATLSPLFEGYHAFSPHSYTIFSPLFALSIAPVQFSSG